MKQSKTGQGNVMKLLSVILVGLLALLCLTIGFGVHKPKVMLEISN